MADAVFSASFLNGCLRNAKHVHMACMAPVVNVRGPLFVHEKGIVKRTTFHVLKMYSDRMQPNVVAGRVVSAPLRVDQASVPALDAVATCSDDGKQIAIAFINRHPEMPARWKLNMGGGNNPEREGSRFSLATHRKLTTTLHIRIALCAETHDLAIGNTTLELPPHSIAMVEATV